MTLIVVAGLVSSCVSANPPVLETTATAVGESGPSSPPVASGPRATADSVAVAAPTRAGRLEPNATVVHVVDGDTLDVVFDGFTKRERIRLIGIDTPESKRPNTPVECFAKKSGAALADLLPLNTPVRVEHDVELRDRYQRYLGYVFRAQDGLFVNLEMARVGMAVPLTFPPNVAYADRFLEAGRAAQAAGAGLWSQCDGPHVPGDTGTGETPDSPAGPG